MSRFKITLVGRLPRHNKEQALEAIKIGLSLSFLIHDSLEDTVIEVEPEESIADLDLIFRRRDDPRIP